MVLTEFGQFVGVVVAIFVVVWFIEPWFTRLINRLQLPAEDENQKPDPAADPDYDADHWDSTLGPMGLPKDERDLAGDAIVHQS